MASRVRCPWGSPSTVRSSSAMEAIAAASSRRPRRTIILILAPMTHPGLAGCAYCHNDGLQASEAIRDDKRGEQLAYSHPSRRPPAAGPRDEVACCSLVLDPHGEEPASAGVSNHAG